MSIAVFVVPVCRLLWSVSNHYFHHSSLLKCAARPEIELKLSVMDAVYL